MLYPGDLTGLNGYVHPIVNGKSRHTGINSYQLLIYNYVYRIITAPIENISNPTNQGINTCCGKSNMLWPQQHLFFIFPKIKEFLNGVVKISAYKIISTEKPCRIGVCRHIIYR